MVPVCFCHQFKQKFNYLFYIFYLFFFFLLTFCSYLKELRQNSNIFPTESLILIFSNIEKIFRFQQKFLDGLRYGIEHNKIAETFLEFVSLNNVFVVVVVFFLCFARLNAMRLKVTHENGN